MENYELTPVANAAISEAVAKELTRVYGLLRSMTLIAHDAIELAMDDSAKDSDFFNKLNRIINRLEEEKKLQ